MVSREIKVTLVGDADKLSRAFKNAGESASGFGKHMGDVAKIASGFVIGAAITSAPAVFQSLTGAASNMAETLSKSNTVFGEQGKAIEQWADGASKSFGQSKQQALDAASSFGNMFTQLGIGEPVAADMSKAMVELASDFASFHNADITEVLTAQQAAFRGEYDALQRFVPTINAAAVEQKALGMTGKATTKELTLQEKALAVQTLMLEGAGDAMGDFDRTSQGAANQSRILSAQFDDLQATIGAKLLPVQIAVGNFILNTLIPALEKLGPIASAAFDGFATVAQRVASVISENLGPPLQRFVEFIDQIGARKALIIGVLTAVTIGFGALAISAGAAAVAVIAATLPLIAIGVAITALVAGIVLLVQNWDVVTAKFPILGAIVTEVQTSFQNFASWITGSFVPAVSNIADTISDTVTRAVNVVQAVWPTIKQIIETTMTAVVAVVEAAWETIRAVIEAAIGIIQGVIQVFVGVLTGDWQMAWDGVKQIVGTAWEFIQSTIQTGVDLVMTILSGLWESVRGGFQAMGDAVMGIVGAIRDEVVASFTNLRDQVIGAADAARDTVVAAFNALKDGAIAAAQGLVSWMQGLGSMLLGAVSWDTLLWGAGGQIISGLVSGITGAAGRAAQAVIDVVGGAISAGLSKLGIRSPSTVFHEMGVQTMQGLANGITQSASVPVGALQRIIDGLIAQLSTGEGRLIDRMTGLASTLAVSLEKSTSESTRRIGKMMGDFSDNIEAAVAGGMKGFENWLATIVDEYVPTAAKNFAAVAQTAGDAFRDAQPEFQFALQWYIESVKRTGDEMNAFLSLLPPELKDIALAMGRALADGINATGPAVVGAMRAIADGVVAEARRAAQAAAAIHAPLAAAAHAPASPSNPVVAGTGGLTQAQKDYIDRMNATNAMQSFAHGTPFVPRDMIAMLHKGEAVIPAHENRGGGGLGQVFGNLQIVLPNVRNEDDLYRGLGRLFAW